MKIAPQTDILKAVAMVGFTTAKETGDSAARQNPAKEKGESSSMKKFIALALALVMALSLVACGGAAAPAESTPASAPADSAAAPAESFKVGMVTDVGGVNDKSFNQGAWEGLQALNAENPAIEVAYLESKTDADYAANLETFVDEGYDLIVSVGFMLAEATKASAEANPEQMYAIVDDASIDLPNVACLMFAQDEASYLVGLVAGMATESGKVGYVQGMVSESMNMFGCGFIGGVLAANPEAEVLQFNANTFGDATVGATAATDMATKGADVIFHAAGGTGNGVIEACETNGVKAIGVDKDQAVELGKPETIITSAMKRVDVSVRDIVASAMEGKFTAGIHMYDLTNGGVDIAPTRDQLTEEMLTAVEDAKAKIIAGEIVVPEKPADLPEGVFTLAE